MMKTLLLVSAIIAFSIQSNAQFTSIPDSNFEQQLINLGYDSGTPDGEVLTASIDTIVSLDVSYSNISSLVGIDDFHSLNTLDCNHNNLSTLDLSENDYLTHVNCSSNQINVFHLSSFVDLLFLDVSNNQLTDLDVSSNLSMITLRCSNNLLNELNVENNLFLINLYCNNNSISHLYLHDNTYLERLHAQSNQLTCLNILDCPLVDLMAQNNPDLMCIQVTDVNDAILDWGNWVDSTAAFSWNCYDACIASMDEPAPIEIRFFPNPTLSEINIYFNETMESIQMTTTNGIGEIMAQETFSNTHGIYRRLKYPPGIYTVQLIVNGNQTFVRKLIVQ